MPPPDLPLRIGDEPRQLRARWVFLPDSDPLENACVVVEDGRVCEIRPANARDENSLDLGNVAIVPGLINAHAHLEFSDLSEPIRPADPFTNWIRNLIAYRAARSTSHEALISDGIAECLSHGTTTIGEIATGEWSPSLLPVESVPRPHMIAFRECIGLKAEQKNEQIDLVTQHIRECRTVVASPSFGGCSQLTPGISPHAPYSVSFDLFEELVAIAGREQVPLCMHLAETRAELELLNSGTGEFVDMLTAFGIWDASLFDKGMRPLDYLKKLVELESASIAHGNYLDEEEIQFLGKHPNIAVVYCPRTHDFFGHSQHPWQRLIEVGANVCLGTDGRSSNPDYSLWAEMQFLYQRNQQNDGQTILQMGTSNACRALGKADQGGRADLAVIQLPSNASANAYDLLFDSESQPIATLIAGVVAG
jgi:aminodeoxyfutalosine deaminase